MDLHTAFESTKNFNFNEGYDNFHIFDPKGFSGKYIPYFNTHSFFEFKYCPDYLKLKQSPFNRDKFIIEDKNALAGIYDSTNEQDRFTAILNHYAFLLKLPNQQSSIVTVYSMEHDHKEICWDGDTPIIYIFSIEYEGNRRYFYEAMMSDGPLEYSQEDFEKFLDHYHLNTIKENLILPHKNFKLK